jgi:hypothetical protein
MSIPLLVDLTLVLRDAYSLRGVGETIAFALSLLCFADILLQLALGPLLPLLCLWATHKLLYALQCTYTANVLRWRVCGIDVRGVVLYGAYPVSVLFLVWCMTGV